MKKCVLSVIGSRRLHELRRGDLVDVVRGVTQRDKIEMAHRFGERIRAIFDSAVDPGDIEAHDTTTEEITGRPDARLLRKVDGRQRPYNARKNLTRSLFKEGGVAVGTTVCEGGGWSGWPDAIRGSCVQPADASGPCTLE